MINTTNKFLTAAALFLAVTLAFAGNVSTAQAAEPTVETRPATNITDDSVRLNGRVNPEGRSTDFWFEYGRDTDLDEDTTVQRLGSFDAEVTVYHNIHGLREDTTYFFRLVAENSDGIERGAIRSFTTDDDGGNDFDDDEPFVSTGSAEQVGNSVVLNANVDPNASWARAWFRYGRTSSSLNNRTTVLTLMGSASRSISRSISNIDLTPGVTYFYQAVAENAFGEERGQVRSFVAGGGPITGGPGPVPTNSPQAFTGSAAVLGRNAATLQAQVNPNGSLASVWFEYGRTTSLGGVTTRDPAGSGTIATNYSATITGLSAGTTYYYRAVAQSPFGISRGQVRTFTTQGAPATPPPSTPSGNGGDGDGEEPAPPTNGAGCLELSPEVSVPQVGPGQDVAYTVTYRNDCGRGLTSATLQLTLPAAVDFAGTNMDFLSRDGNVITYSIGEVAENFQATVTVDVRVKEQVNAGDSLLFEANMSYTDSAGRPRTESGFVSATIVGEPVVENGTSTLGASIGDALGGLFQNGWFWLVLFLILIALFIFWLATRRRQDEDEDDEIVAAHEA